MKANDAHTPNSPNRLFLIHEAEHECIAIAYDYDGNRDPDMDILLPPAPDPYLSKLERERKAGLRK